MVQRLAVPAFAGVTLAAAGCSLALDFDGRRVVDADAGASADAAVPTGPSVAHFDSYHFQRGSRTFRVTAATGLLLNDGAGATLRRGAFSTTAGGRVELSDEGSFEYTPPGPSAAFWGNDHFEYELLGRPGSRARVRLTIHPPALSLSELRASGGSGFGIAGAQAQDVVGVEPTALAPAGDVNGDGLQDFVIGVRGPLIGTEIQEGEGRGAYVLFGKGNASDVSLGGDGASRAPGFSIVGEGSSQVPTGFGMVVGGAGDVNGDGLDDVIVGSRRMRTDNGFGAAYVVFGKTDASPVLSEEILAGNGGGFAIQAGAGADPENFALVGYDVDGACDVNGDGLDDVIVGVPFFSGANGGDAGGAFVVFGKVGPEPVSVSAIAAGEPLGFPIFGNAPGEFLGLRAAGLGDVNGDGLCDVAVSSYLTANESGRGRTAVVLGKLGASPVRVADIEGGSGSGFVLTGADNDDLAANVIGAGDVNGDGLDDLLIGAPGASVGPSPAGNSAPVDAGDAGAAGDAGDLRDAGAPLEPEPPPAGPDGTPGGVIYVVFGSQRPQSFDLGELESASPRGFAITGRGRVRQLGDRLGAGDVDGDGLSDILAAAVPDAAYARAFVILGGASSESIVLPPEASAAPGVLTLICPPEEVACQSLASGADSNGDGIDDLLVGVPLYPDAPQAAGGAYLAFGWDMNRALASRDAALIGTAADDVLELPETPIVIARGGRGTDTLRPGAPVAEIDLTLLGRYESIEIIDVRGNGPQRVLLDDAALRRIPQHHSGFAFMMAKKLTVLGDAEDTLVFDLAGYDVRGGSAGRVVYGREGSYYGLELSQALRVQP